MQKAFFKKCEGIVCTHCLLKNWRSQVALTFATSNLGMQLHRSHVASPFAISNLGLHCAIAYMLYLINLKNLDSGLCFLFCLDFFCFWIRNKIGKLFRNNERTKFRGFSDSFLSSWKTLTTFIFELLIKMHSNSLVLTQFS